MLRVCRLLQLLGETEIYEFDVAVDIDDDILRLQVSVYNVLLMQDLEGEKDLCRVELHPVFLVLFP